MGIDFHDTGNRRPYSDREAHNSWREGRSRPERSGRGRRRRRRLRWSEARESQRHLPGVAFRQGDAGATGLDAECADVVFERALVHHVPDLAAVATEAARLLRPGRVLLIQDRTGEDVAQPGSVSHPLGWLFEVFPRPLEVETARRPTPDAVFRAPGGGRLRRRHDVVAVGSAAPLCRPGGLPRPRRTGRSILHELDDAEVGYLVPEPRERLPDGPVVEQDRWSLWRSTRGS